jgi:L-amino acid N-acyltransferase
MATNDGQPKFLIRPADAKHAEGINYIQSWYIKNTVKTIWYNAFSVSETETKIKDTLTAGYPFLVAVDASDDSILGYAQLSKYRPQDGWSSVAELSIFVHHGHRRKGIGKELLHNLISTTKKNYTQGRTEPHIEHIIAVVATDEEKLESFYKQFGFQQVGLLPRAGHKFGKR